MPSKDNKNSKGPRMEPWGTPEINLAVMEEAL